MRRRRVTDQFERAVRRLRKIHREAAVADVALFCGLRKFRIILCSREPAVSDSVATTFWRDDLFR